MARKVGKLSPFNITALALGTGVSVPADRDPRHLFLQRFAAGHGVGRLVAALVP